MGGTVLYIDDEKELPGGFEKALSGAGFQLLHVSDPDEALRLVRVEEVDLVLVELVLSSCYGLSMLEEMRRFGGWPAEVPVVVLTKGERSPELYGGSLELGARDFITKPATKAELIESIRQFAGQPAEPPDVDPSQTQSTPPAEATLQGDLAETPIPEILHRLRAEAATGVLTVKHRKNGRAIELRNGSPVAIGSRGGFESPEDYLLRRKLITARQRDAVLQRKTHGLGGSGEILVEIGALTEQEFADAIREQADELLLATFGWTSGPFRYFPGKKAKAEVSLEISRNPAELILEGTLHWSEGGPISELLRGRGTLYVSKNDDPPYDMGEIELTSAQRRYLDELEGDQSVRQVIDSGTLGERRLYGLLVAGFLELQDEPVIMLLEEEAPRPKRQARRQPPPEPEAPAEPPRARLKPKRATAEIPIVDLDAAPLAPTAPKLGRDEPPPPTAEPPQPLLEPSPLAAIDEVEADLEIDAGEEPQIEVDEPSAPAATTSRAREPELEVDELLGDEPDEPSGLDLDDDPDDSPSLEVDDHREPAATSLPPAEPLAAEAFANEVGAIGPVGAGSLQEMWDEMGSQDDFDVLGVDGDSSDREVRDARGRLLDSVASAPGDAGIAARVRQRVEQAYKRLKDKDTRHAYAKLRRGTVKVKKKKQTPEEAAAARGIDAESAFRKGEDFLEAKRYDEAVEHFGIAAHLDPKQGEYLAHLGYALFLNNPSNAIVLREALEHLAKGIKLSPRQEKSYLYLGKIFRANGADERARKQFERALRLNPNCHAALQEMRLLNLRGEKEGSLINKMKGLLKK